MRNQDALDALGEICQRHQLYFVVDSAQTAGIVPINMDKMHIDALAFTGHKGLRGHKGQVVPGFPGIGRTNGTTDFRRYRKCISYGRNSGFYAGSL